MTDSTALASRMSALSNDHDAAPKHNSSASTA